MGDSIMHYTVEFFTLYSTAFYTATFLLGIWFAGLLSASYGRLSAIAALVSIAVAFYLRNGSHPLSAIGIGAMIVVHVTGGMLLGLYFRRKKSYQYQSPTEQ